MSIEPYIYTVRLDNRPELEGAYNAWCHSRHMPDLLGAGFWGATRYRSTEGEPKYLHLYEIPGPEIFQTPEYRSICRCEPPCDAPACLNKADPDHPTGTQMNTYSLNGSRAVYEQLVTFNTSPVRTYSPGRDGDPVGSIKTRSIYTVRMDLDPALEEEYIRWHRDTRFAEIMRLPGFVSGRLARKIDSFERGGIEPEYMALFELESVDAPAGLSTMAQDAQSDRMRGAMHNRKRNVMERLWPE